MQVDPTVWPRVSALLDEALEIEAGARAAWLATLGARDPDLQDTLRHLLGHAAAVETGDFLATLAPLTLDGPAAEESGSALPPGTVVGAYVIEHEAGRGGMGIVYRAHRADNLIERPVALKLLHPGAHSDALLARFAREREILARLTHPHIARLYDAGVADGQPYIALEFVAGTPLLTYCDARRLDVRSRVELFGQVLRAVHFAHSNLVVHRDLKPSNILVTDAGEVRLLDFGIAKLLSAPGGARAGVEGEAGAVTEFGPAFTPDYSAPEQISGASITTATDVYAAGVVLYELLTGLSPYGPARRTRHALEKAILAGVSLPPSRAPCTEEQARLRDTTPERLRHALKGDLDTVVAKALKQDPRERYASADALWQDLQHYLRNEPLAARPDRRWYRIGKFVARHRVPVSLAAGAVLALVAGLAVALWQAQVAEREAQVAAATQEFLTSIFESNSSSGADPVKARNRTARELLDASASQVDAKLRDAPLARLRVLATLATLYSDDLGLADKGAELSRDRVNVAKELYGPNDVRVAEALVDLAGTLYESSTPDEESSVLDEAGRILNGAHDFSSKTRADFYLRQAEIHQSADLEKTIRFARQAVELLRRQPATINLANALGMQGIAHTARDENRDAERVLTEALSVSQSIPGSNIKRALPILYSYLAQAQNGLGEYPLAEQNYRRALDTARQFDGEQHENVLESQLRLGGFLARTGRPREGLQLLRQALDLAQRTQGPAEGFHTPRVLLELGKSLLLFGNPADAIAALNRAIELRRVRDRERGPTRMLAQMLEARADAEISAGTFDAASADLKEAAEIRASVKDLAGSKRLNDALLARARLAAATGRLADAVAALDTTALGAGVDALAPIRLDVELERARIAMLGADFDGAGKRADSLRARMAASDAAPYLVNFTSRSLGLSGEAQFRMHHTDQAVPLLQEAVRLDEELQDTAHSPRFAQVNRLLDACRQLRDAQAR
ncbi:MAG: serine/threonine protein kinase [Proteobacteria bacterium]|nr:serine/threonine protein kinase [Pseudomonadota bacterium]